MLLLTATPGIVSAQLTAPCRAACGTVLGATAFVAATGTVVAAGRLVGGLARVEQGLAIWGGSFALCVGAGFALHDDGERQRRAVYAAGLGTLGGSLVGFGLQALRADEGPDERLTGALAGAAAGAVLGGMLGALTHDGGGPSAARVPLLAVRLPFQ